MDDFEHYRFPLNRWNKPSHAKEEDLYVGDIVLLHHYKGIFEITGITVNPDDPIMYINLMSVSTRKILRCRGTNLLSKATPDEIVRWKLENG
jgi:hypothetical protein